jgi:gluconolactonase
MPHDFLVRLQSAAGGAVLTVLVLCGVAVPCAASPEVAASGLQFPEGTIFVGNNLYFVDYSTSDVLRLAGHKVEKVWHQDGCGANGLGQVAGGLLVACYEAGTVVHISPDGKTIETLRSDDKGQPFLYPNDFGADASGGVYFSGSGTESSLGKVYYRSSDGRVREVAANIHYANGLAVSPDGKTLYLAESAANRLLAFDIAANGALSGQREFVRLAEILSLPGQPVFTPDGVRVDNHGNLFVGLYRGGGFAVISPQAKLLKLIPLPGAHHANLAISPNGRSVFVTSADDESDGTYRGALLVVPNPVAE